jgi:hypothetical protein
MNSFETENITGKIVVITGAAADWEKQPRDCSPLRARPWCSERAIWVGTGEMPMQPKGVNRLGSWIGAMALAQPDESPYAAPNSEDMLSGELPGKRVARLVSSSLVKAG